MRTLFTAFARNTVFANIVLALVFFAGGMALFNLPRETFPEPSMDMVTVIVVWRGADPSEVEEGICRKIEEAIEGIEGIKRYNTMARENVGIAKIECFEHYDIDEIKDRVKDAVDTITTFPPDAERPVTEKVKLYVPVLFVALGGKDVSETDLKEEIEKIKDDLIALPELSRIEVQGTRDYEISIEVSEEKLREYGINFEQVSKLVRANCLNLPGGVMRTQGEEIRLRTVGRKYTGEEFAKIVVLARPNGDKITLDQIASIHDDFSEDRVIPRFNGLPGVMVEVQKTSEEDSLEIDQAVLDYVAKKQRELPSSVELTVWGRFATLLQARISLLVRNGVIGLVLVFLMLWLFLDIRLSFWASMGMPVSILGALVVMWAMGESINMISLFGLIMVLGIIVDDAIVLGEAIYVARKNGAPPLQAAVDGVMEVGMPVVAAVTTTIIAFMPLIFISGWMGKIIRILPLVVIASLSISLMECIFLLPAHLSHLPVSNGKRQRTTVTGWRALLVNGVRLGNRFHRITNGGLESFGERIYYPIVMRVVRWRYVSICVVVMIGLTVSGVYNSGLIEFEFFPEIDGNAIKATVEFVSGTPLERTDAIVVEMGEAIERVAARSKTLSGQPVIKNMFSLSGARLDEMSNTEFGVNYGMVRVELLDTGERGIYFRDLISEWEKEIGNVPGLVSLSFSGDEIRPPGAPIEIWLQGHDLDELIRTSKELQIKLGSYLGVYEIQDDYREGKNEMRLALKPEARMSGITVYDLARQVYAGYFGEEANRIQRGKDDIRVRVRYPEDERTSLGDFEQIRIRSPYGFEVPFSAVADVDYGPGPSVINRTDGLRRIRVTAQVDSKVANSSEIVKSLERGFFDNLRQAHPAIKISLQGEQENLRDALGSIYIGFPIAIVGIFIIIATVFRSYVQPLVILFTVPFGFIGAILGHLALGFDLSIMSIFGTVALAGIVVNDAIVLIECINTNIAKGLPFYEAVCRGGVRRFRAIFLTTISTIGGLTPLILENDFQAQILIPMAIAVAAGVGFATLLTLLLIPSLMCVLNDLRRLMHRLLQGTWPTPEEVEPARLRAMPADFEVEADGPFMPEDATVGEDCHAD